MTTQFAIMGMGLTGFSVAHFLASTQQTFVMIDEHETPARLAEFTERFPDVPLFLGKAAKAGIAQADVMIKSPGIPLNHPLLVAAEALNKPIQTDISLFMQAAKAPVVAVTGSNGKSTVVSLLAHLAAGAFTVELGGNIGIPALELLQKPVPDFYILELSSFQLMHTDNLNTFAAVVLNITPDHLDWHNSFEEYAQAKLRLYEQCAHPVVLATFPHEYAAPSTALHYALSSDQTWIEFQGAPLIKVDALPFIGKPYLDNVLAAFELAHRMGVSNTILIERVKTFQGLKHRCEKVCEHEAVTWYNDSKATNVGACIAAINTIKSAHTGNIVLVLSGLSKGVDLSALTLAISKNVSYLILLGEAVWPLYAQFEAIPHCQVSNVAEVVQWAKSAAEPGDVVLFSPAGASFDLFDHYAHRGELFCEAIKESLC